MSATRVQYKVADTTNPTATFDTTPTEGNLLIAFTMHRSGTASASTSISGTGWTKVVAQDTLLTNTSYRRHISCWWKLAGASEPTAIQVSGATLMLMTQEFSTTDGGFTYLATVSNDNGATSGGTVLSSGTTSSVSGDKFLEIAFCGMRRGVGTNAFNSSWDNNLANDFNVGTSNFGRLIGTAFYDADVTDGTKESTVTFSSSPFPINTGFDTALLVFELASTATNYTLTADGGTFALSGQTSDLLFKRKLIADNGSFTLSGQTSDLLFNRNLVSDAGNFNLTGQDSNLLFNRLLASDVGAFNLTGNDIGLLYNRVLNVENGAFILSGQDTSLHFNRLLTLENGSFVLTGNDADLIYTPIGGYVLTADGGSFNLTGFDSNLLSGRNLISEVGNYNLTGIDSNLLFKRKLISDFGQFNLTGQDVSLVYAIPGGYILSADTGNFNLTISDIDLLFNRLMSAGTGSFNLTGNDVDLLFNRVMTALKGQFNLSGQDANLIYDAIEHFVLTANFGQFNLTGQSVELNYDTGVLNKQISGIIQARVVAGTVIPNGIKAQIIQEKIIGSV